MLPLLPPSSEVAHLAERYQGPVTPMSASQSDGVSPTSSFLSCMSNFFWMPWNAFGLWRKYPSEMAPTHDPEESVTLEDMVDVEPKIEANINFGPYPNENSYLLGDWYWSHGAQKSKDSFQELISIVSWSDFNPEDVANMSWHKMDA